MDKTWHKQVRVHLAGRRWANVDYKIASFIRLLWSVGIVTRYSCQNPPPQSFRLISRRRQVHFDGRRRTGHVWIAFDDADSAKLFRRVFWEAHWRIKLSRNDLFYEAYIPHATFGLARSHLRRLIARGKNVAKPTGR